VLVAAAPDPLFDAADPLLAADADVVADPAVPVEGAVEVASARSRKKSSQTLSTDEGSRW
jgi:hypothetical protein